MGSNTAFFRLHAAHHAQRGADGRQDADKGLQDHFPGVFLAHDD